MQENKYRGVVQQTLIDQPISNFMNPTVKLHLAMCYSDSQLKQGINAL
jgi:hypothetical protein